MILCASTSSPVTSLALISDEGEVAFHGSRRSHQNASADLFALLDEAGGPGRLNDVSLFVSDVGPGSFTGTRVAVMFCKVLASVHGKMVASVSAFDLIAPLGDAFLPNRKDEWFVRLAGEVPTLQSEVPANAAGYGALGVHGREESWPDAAGIAALRNHLIPMPPEMLVAIPLVQPSISVPKTPFKTGGP